jgi:ribosomal protein L30/L7E
MIAAIRLRGHNKIRADHEDTLKVLGMKKANTLVLLRDDINIRGMINKVSDFIAWGEASKEIENLFGDKTPAGLKAPKGGFRSLKKHWPKGDLGYRGEAINDLIKRMM